MRLGIAVILGLFVATSDLPAQGRYEATRAHYVRRQPYRGYVTTDSLGRRVTFYVSEASDSARLPLVLYVQGSGSGSHFRRDGERTIPSNGHGTLADAARGRFRVVIVEKPGVELFDDGTARRQAFVRDFSLQKWAEAVAAAAIAARGLPGVDSSRALVIGHSEGGIVAARVAGRLPWLTHAAVLAGGGPSQLEDLRILARIGSLFAEHGNTADAREAHVMAAWDSISASPEATDRAWFGHTYLRWSSFLGSSTIAELARSRAAVFVAQGELDAVVSLEGFEFLVGALRQTGRSVQRLLVGGADHSFSSGPGRDGWSETLGAVLGWFSPR